jgi:hypothetical protein
MDVSDANYIYCYKQNGIKGVNKYLKKRKKKISYEINTCKIDYMFEEFSAEKQQVGK